MMSKQQGSWAWLGNNGVVSVTSLWIRLATSSSMQAIRNACWSGRDRTQRLEDASWYRSRADTIFSSVASVIFEYFWSWRVKRLFILLACLVLCPLFAVKERRTSCSLLFSKLYSSAILTAYVGLRENIGTLSNWYLLIPTAPCYATKL